MLPNGWISTNKKKGIISQWKDTLAISFVTLNMFQDVKYDWLIFDATADVKITAAQLWKLLNTFKCKWISLKQTLKHAEITKYLMHAALKDKYLNSWQIQLVSNLKIIQKTANAASFCKCTQALRPWGLIDQPRTDCFWHSLQEVTPPS